MEQALRVVAGASEAPASRTGRDGTGSAARHPSFSARLQSAFVPTIHVRPWAIVSAKSWQTKGVDRILVFSPAVLLAS
jgi:hypothetical protein